MYHPSAIEIYCTLRITMLLYFDALIANVLRKIISALAVSFCLAGLSFKGCRFAMKLF